MTSKQTKRALLGSLTSLLLCFAMLIGSTFAWFTDTASTSVNTIQAGTLKVKLEKAKAWDATTGAATEWDEAEDQTMGFVVKQADGTYAVGSNVLWEPGCTYKLPELKITNDGNLAIKYKIAITGIKGDAELNNAIDWTIEVGGQAYTLGSDLQLGVVENDKSAVLTVSGHMKESAGNEYQGKKIENIAITVYATQAAAEYDSNGNTYDANAEYPPTIDEELTITESGNIDSDIARLLEGAGASDVVLLTLKNDGTETKNVTLNNSTLANVKNVTFDLKEGVELSVNNIAVADGQTVKITGEGTIKNGYWPVCSGGTLIIENEGGFQQENMGNAMISIAKYGANVVIKDYEIKNNTTSLHSLIEVGSDSDYDVAGYTEPSKLTLENVTMDATVHFSNGRTGQAAGIYVFAGSLNVVTNNVTFNGNSTLSTLAGGNYASDVFLSVKSGAAATLNGTTVQ